MRNDPRKLYQQSRMDTVSGKGIEISILEMAAGKLRQACAAWSPDGANNTFDEALRFNQKVWDVFQADWSNENSTLPVDLRQSLLSLSVFVRKQTFDAIAFPALEKAETLIQLNDNLASGLRGNVAQPKETLPQKAFVPS